MDKTYFEGMTNTGTLDDPSNPSIFTSTTNDSAEFQSCLSTAGRPPNQLCANSQDLDGCQESTHSAAQTSSLLTTLNPIRPPSPRAAVPTTAQQQHFTRVTTASATAPSQPVQIPTVFLPFHESVRISTPLSARERNHNFFPHPNPRTPSPHGLIVAQSSDHHLSPTSDDNSPGRGRGRGRSSSSSPSLIFSMHGEPYTGRYMPTSPLSPKLPSSSRPLSPQSTTTRPSHPRSTSRNLHMTLPRYHPANFGLQLQHGPAANAATPSSTSQSPAVTLNRASAPMNLHIDSPRSMRANQRELLDTVRLSSIIAASQKPGAPRLNPLGSPKGAVTPLALEEATDYFSVTRTGTGKSPATSPGPKNGSRVEGSPRRAPEAGPEGQGKKKVDVYE